MITALRLKWPLRFAARNLLLLSSVAVSGAGCGDGPSFGTVAPVYWIHQSQASETAGFLVYWDEGIVDEHGEFYTVEDSLRGLWLVDGERRALLGSDALLPEFSPASGALVYARGARQLIIRRPENGWDWKLTATLPAVKVGSPCWSRGDSSIVYEQYAGNR